MEIEEDPESRHVYIRVEEDEERRRGGDGWGEPGAEPVQMGSCSNGESHPATRWFCRDNQGGERGCYPTARTVLLCFTFVYFTLVPFTRGLLTFPKIY